MQLNTDSWDIEILTTYHRARGQNKLCDDVDHSPTILPLNKISPSIDNNKGEWKLLVDASLNMNAVASINNSVSVASTNVAWGVLNSTKTVMCLAGNIVRRQHVSSLAWLSDLSTALGFLFVHSEVFRLINGKNPSDFGAFPHWLNYYNTISQQLARDKGVTAMTTFWSKTRQALYLRREGYQRKDERFDPLDQQRLCQKYANDSIRKNCSQRTHQGDHRN